MSYKDLMSAKDTLEIQGKRISYFNINKMRSSRLGDISRLPYSIKIMLESLLRNLDGEIISEADIVSLSKWQPNPGNINVPLKLSRVVLQDFTGVPAVVDLAALRSAMNRAGK